MFHLYFFTRQIILDPVLRRCRRYTRRIVHFCEYEEKEENPQKIN